jgi:hypothetical protein
MSVNSYALTIPATGSIILEPGNFLLLISASAPVTIILQTNAGREQFTGQSSGLRVQRLKNWANAQILGTVGTTVTIYYGIEQPREDAVDFISVIATIAGSVTVVPGIGSSNALTNHADVTVAATTLDATIVANAARKMLIVGSKSTNAPGVGLNLRLQGGAGVAANQGIELQPGVSYSFGVGVPVSIAAYAVYNPAAASQVYWWIEGT